MFDDIKLKLTRAFCNWFLIEWDENLVKLGNCLLDLCLSFNFWSYKYYILIIFWVHLFFWLFLFLTVSFANNFNVKFNFMHKQNTEVFSTFNIIKRDNPNKFLLKYII